jgi:hypothetical protein
VIGGRFQLEFVRGKQGAIAMMADQMSSNKLAPGSRAGVGDAAPS